MRETSKKSGLAQELAELLKNTHNLILHGAPGTGKTHLAYEIAEQMNAKEVEVVQFHPLYNYADFVEKLVPEGGQTGWEMEDGAFKKFCRRAQEAYDESISYEYYVEDNFDDAYQKLLVQLAQQLPVYYETVQLKARFKVELRGSGRSKQIYVIPKDGAEEPISYEALRDYLRAHEPSVLDRYKYIRAISQHLIDDFGYKKDETAVRIEKPVNFVFIIDEINRGELYKIFGELFLAIEPRCRGRHMSTRQEEEDFCIPKNVYIIGTMNDIDCGAGSIDFAMRRRFAFKEIKAKDTQKDILCGDKGLPAKIQAEAIRRMDSLNKKIESIEGLSSDYHIGATYFLYLKELNGDFSKLWEYYLKDLLREYIRGMKDAKQLIGELKEAYDIQGE